jgi:hypothetical protein
MGMMKILNGLTLPALNVTLALLTGCGGGGSSSPPPPPTITQQPQSLTANAGDAATFSVTASGASTYQWQKNGQSIAGATSASYTLPATTSQDNGEVFTVAVANDGGTVVSSGATLRVTGVSVIAGQLGGMGYADGPASQARFWGPIALAFDSQGDLFVADYNAVRMIAPDGTVSTVAGSARVCGSTPGAGSAARLCYPYSLATDSAGNVYAGDTAGVVWKISAGAASILAGGFSCPYGLAASGATLFVADECLGSITQIQGGAGSLYASTGFNPAGLSLDGLQNIYVASDTVVQVVAPGPPVVTTDLAGTRNMPGSASGVGAAARFGCANYPYALDSGTDAPFNGAFGIVTTAAGLSYVSDYCNNVIRTVDAAGTVSEFAGVSGSAGTTNGPGAGAKFWGPTGLAMDVAGNVYVADYGNALIREISPSGVVSTYAGMEPHFGGADGTGAAASFRYPRGVATDGGGNLYVADDNHTIRRITPAGVVSTLAGTPGVIGSADGAGSAALFFNPKGLAADTAGNLYVADTSNYTIRKVTPAGVVSTFAGTAGVRGLVDGTGANARFTSPGAIAVDASANVYVTDGLHVRMITAAGAVTTISVMLSGTPAIAGITVDSSGLLYITTSAAVYSLTQGGTLTRIAGGSSTGSADGTGAAAGFNLPTGIVMGGDGNLYVADQQNSTIRKVTPTGVVTTPVGTAVMPMGIVPGGLPAHLGSPWGLAVLSSGAQVSLAVTDEWESVILRVDLP